MAWPDDQDLPIEVQAAFGADLTADPGTWSWTDLTVDGNGVSRLKNEAIRLRAGRSSGAGHVSPGTCTVTLLNDDAALTPLHPMSPYWPHVELGTPLRVRVQWGGVWHERFAGVADQWEPTYVPTSTPGECHSAVRVTCSGILRRLTQGTPPARSPLQRTIAASGPAAYYPGEDGVTATVAGSALSGENPLVVSGAVEFKPVEDYQYNTTTIRYGTSALGDLAAGGSLSVTFGDHVAAATRTAWTVHVVGEFDVAYASGDIVLMEWTTPGGTYVRWRLVESPSTLHTQVIAYTADGAATVVVDRVGVLGGFRTWVVSAQQSGSNIQVTYRIDATTSLTGSVAGTLAGVASLAVNPTGTTSSRPMPFGHLAVWGAADVPYRTDAVIDEYGGVVHAAIRSYQGEPAHVRLARLTAEDGLTLDMPAVDAAAAQRMGWQPVGAPMDLYQECVEIDLGVLYEQGFGLGYLPRSDRYNRPPDMTVDLSTYCVTADGQAGVLTPIYDDRDIRNELTVERRDGSSVVVSDLGSQQRHGVYGDSVELNAATDGQLADQAGWRLHLSTVVDLREQTFPLDLAANPSLIGVWLSCHVGSRIVRTNPPAQYRPGDLDRLVEGWTETIGPRSWMVQVTPSPAAPWQVAEVDGEQRVPADGSVLAADLTEAGMSLLLSSTAANGPWTEDATDMPLDIRVGGERVTAAAIGLGLPGTVEHHHTARGVFQATRVAVGATDIDVTVGRISVSAAPAGGTAEIGVRVRESGANFADVRLFVSPGDITIAVRQLLDGAETFDGFPSVSGSATTPMSVRIQAAGSILRAKAWPAGTAQPDAWNVQLSGAVPFAGDLAITSILPGGTTNALPWTVQVGDVVSSPQRVTLSARAVNGITRAWPAGTEVDVWEPAIIPL